MRAFKGFGKWAKVTPRPGKRIPSRFKIGRLARGAKFVGEKTRCALGFKVQRSVEKLYTPFKGRNLISCNEGGSRYWGKPDNMVKSYTAKGPRWKGNWFHIRVRQLTNESSLQKKRIALTKKQVWGCNGGGSIVFPHLKKGVTPSEDRKRVKGCREKQSATFSETSKESGEADKARSSQKKNGQEAGERGG